MQIDNMAVMTAEEFAKKSGLSKHQVRTWLESGLLEAKTINGPDGPRQWSSLRPLTNSLLVGRAAMDQVGHSLQNSQSRMPSCQLSGGVSAFARSRPAQPRIDRYHL